MSYRLNILGTLDLRDASGTSINAVLQQPRRAALLIYLALSDAEVMVKRDTLLGFFWPEMTQENGRRALSQALHFLRSRLGRNSILARGNEDVALNGDVVHCDAARFLAAAKAGDLQTAAVEYAGDLLPGFFVSGSPEFDQWLEATREQLRRTAAEVFWTSAEEARQSGKIVSAAAFARRAAELAFDNESATRRLMEFLANIDDRAGALDAYDGLVRTMHTEYETTPSSKTQHLAEQIRGDNTPIERIPVVADHNRLRSLPWQEIRQRGRTLTGAALLMFAFVSLWGLGTRDRAQPARTDASLTIETPEVFDAELRDEAAEILNHASAALVSVPNLKVLTRTGENGSAHFVLKPEFTERDGRVRISASLVDAATGTLVRSASFEVAGDNASSLNAAALNMSEFTRKEVGRYLRAAQVNTTSGPDAAVVSRAMSARIRSDSLLEQGLAEYAVLTLDRADQALQKEIANRRNAELFVQRAAIARDKAWAFIMPPLTDNTKMNEAIEEGIKAADHAIAMQPRNASAHEMRGLLVHLQWFTSAPQSKGAHILRSEAERSLRKAVDLNANAARAWSALGQILVAKGDFAEAYWSAERGYSADTYVEVHDALTTTLFTASLETRDFAAAERWCSDISRRMPGTWNGAHCRLQLLASKDRPSTDELMDGERIVKEVIANSNNAPFAPVLHSVLAVAYAKAGNAARTRALLATSESGMMAGEAQPFRAWAMRHLGERNKARALLTSYVQENPTVRAGVARSARYEGLF